MKDRGFIGVISTVGFLLVAFTPIIPLMLHHYSIDNTYIVKASIGVVTLICGYGIYFGFFKKENLLGKSKEGKIRIRIVLLSFGVICICIAWFTGLPNWLADITGLSNTFVYGGELINGGLGTRIFVSFLTAIGIILIKMSIIRKKYVFTESDPSVSQYEQALKGAKY